MGRLSEYDEEEQGSTPYPVVKERDAQLGARVRELLASEEPPEGLELEMLRVVSPGQLAWNAWAWFREQLLGGAPAAPAGVVAGEQRLGPLVLYAGLGFWVGGTCFEDGGTFHHASEAVLREAADAWNREQQLGVAVAQLIRAATFADWEQVRQNGGPPCFHLDGEHFCLRAERWAGHPVDHAFISLAALLETADGR